ncbi:MAG: hypothetical protein AAFP84_07265 [Actinomycetota bacterium]
MGHPLAREAPWSVREDLIRCFDGRTLGRDDREGGQCADEEGKDQPEGS